MNQVSARNFGIDIFRLIAMLAVVILHTDHFKYIEGYQFLFFLLDNTARFAVPFFFITSGYFFGKAIQKYGSPHLVYFRYTKRLLLILFAWILIYFLIPKHFVEQGLEKGIPGLLTAIPEHIKETLLWIKTHKIQFIFRTQVMHLWFLTSLILSLTLLALLSHFKKEKYILPFSTALYFVGLLAGSYSNTPLGIQLPDSMVARDGIFMSTFFIALGWWLADWKKFPSARIAILLIVSGWLLHLTEAALLWKITGVKFYNHDFVLGTIPFGAGVFFLALSNPKLGEGTIFPQFGLLALGIYVAHLLVLTNISFVGEYVNPLLWQILFPIIGFLMSILLVILFKRWKSTSFLVT